jgi:hypothetical protein
VSETERPGSIQAFLVSSAAGVLLFGYVWVQLADKLSIQHARGLVAAVLVGLVCLCTTLSCITAIYNEIEPLVF